MGYNGSIILLRYLMKKCQKLLLAKPPLVKKKRQAKDHLAEDKDDKIEKVEC